MPSIVTASQLRAVLGVASSLYDDTYLNGIIDTAEGIILPMLVANTSAVRAVKLEDNVAYYYTVRPHGFVTGQSIVITGLPAPFTRTVVVTKTQKQDIAWTVNGWSYPLFLRADAPLVYYFAGSVTNADIDLKPTIPNGTASLSGYSAAEIYANSQPVESAVLAVCVEVFQSRTAAGGQIEGVDFSPTPFRMGRSLMNRVIGLLGPFLDVETLAQ